MSRAVDGKVENTGFTYFHFLRDILWVLFIPLPPKIALSMYFLLVSLKGLREVWELVLRLQMAQKGILVHDQFLCTTFSTGVIVQPASYTLHCYYLAAYLSICHICALQVFKW